MALFVSLLLAFVAAVVIGGTVYLAYTFFSRRFFGDTSAACTDGESDKLIKKLEAADVGIPPRPVAPTGLKFSENSSHTDRTPLELITDEDPSDWNAIASRGGVAR